MQARECVSGVTELVVNDKPSDGKLGAARIITQFIIVMQAHFSA